MILNLNKVFNLDKLPLAALIYASEEYMPLINLITDHFKKLLPNHMLYKFEADRYFDLSSVDQVIGNTSLFDTINYIEINYKTKPVIEQQSKLVNTLDNLNPNNFLCIITNKLTSKELTNLWAEKINDCGIILSINEADLKTLITSQLAKYNLSITNSASDCLIELNQANSAALVQELNKLCLLHPSGTQIDIAKIQSQDNSQYNIYQLSNAYLVGNLANCLKIFDNVYLAIEDAILINWIIHEDIKKLIKIKNNLRQNISLNQAISNVKGWGDSANNLASANNRLSYNALLTIIDKLALIDMSIKGVNTNDVRQQLQSVLLMLCGNG